MGHAKETWDKVEEFVSGYGEIALPPLVTKEIKADFKHLPYSLSRYKFAGKMLEGKKSVIEVGCNAGFKTMMLSQFVETVVGLDYSESAIKFANENYADEKRSYLCADITQMEPFKEKVDAAVSLDVIEHIPQEDEDTFIAAIANNLKEDGVCIIGTPNITASAYQSEETKISHINLYSHQRLRDLMGKYFDNVFMFGMNDEVVHTGYPAMSHYIIAMGVGLKRK